MGCQEQPWQGPVPGKRDHWAWPLGGETWSAACSAQLVGQGSGSRDGPIPCASAPEAAGSVAAGALHGRHRGGGEAHCLINSFVVNWFALFSFFILCPFCFKSRKRLNKDIPYLLGVNIFMGEYMSLAQFTWSSFTQALLLYLYEF